MAEHKKYIIKVSSKLVEATREFYCEYHCMDRRERHLEEKDLQHGKTLYSSPDTPELLGEGICPDWNTVSTEDAAVARILHEKLRRCLKQLPESDRALLHAIYLRA